VLHASLSPDDAARVHSAPETKTGEIFAAARAAGRVELRSAYVADAVVALMTGDAPAVEGCDSTLRLEIDHIVPVAGGGTTDTTNNWRICEYHHKLETYYGWTVVGPPGARRLLPPDDPDPPRPRACQTPARVWPGSTR
jgi:hypothetical protein